MLRKAQLAKKRYGILSSIANSTKKIQADLQAPEWERIQQYLTQELFNTTYAQNVLQQRFIEQHYTGFNLTRKHKRLILMLKQNHAPPAQYQAT